MSLFDDNLISRNILDDYAHPKNKEELRKSIEYYISTTKPKLRDTIDLNWIDTSAVKDMCRLFNNAPLWHYNFNVSKWDVSNVKDMSSMFEDCDYFNCDLSKWDVSNVVNMDSMFYNCKQFNSDISKWDVSNVVNMDYMFWGCTNFNQDISKWVIRTICTPNSIFFGCFLKEDYKPLYFLF